MNSFELRGLRKKFIFLVYGLRPNIFWKKKLDFTGKNWKFNIFIQIWKKNLIRNFAKNRFDTRKKLTMKNFFFFNFRNQYRFQIITLFPGNHCLNFELFWITRTKKKILFFVHGLRSNIIGKIDFTGKNWKSNIFPNLQKIYQEFCIASIPGKIWKEKFQFPRVSKKFFFKSFSKNLSIDSKS